MDRLQGYGMDTITLNGPLQARLAAIRQAGFGQAMLSARDVAGFPGGVAAAAAAVRASGLRPMGLQVLRDFEGLSDHLHEYKLDIAKSMLRMCADIGSPVLLASSSTSHHATADLDLIARDLRKLAMLGIPLGIRIAYEGLSWGRTIREFTSSWDVVCRADMPNLGLCLNSFHIFASGTPLQELEVMDPASIFLVRLSDAACHEAAAPDDCQTLAGGPRVFPGEGVRSAQLADFVRRLERLGYRGGYSFEVFNDDYQQLPPDIVAQRARRSALWLNDDVLHRPAPLPAWTSTLLRTPLY